MQLLPCCVKKKLEEDSRLDIGPPTDVIASSSRQSLGVPPTQVVTSQPLPLRPISLQAVPLPRTSTYGTSTHSSPYGLPLYPHLPSLPQPVQ